jgi:phosphate transport system substrate-binding protein
MSDSRRPRILVIASALALLGAASARAQGQHGDPREVQAARNARSQARGKENWYPADKFDLSGLPAYQPEQRVSGTLRIFGQDYFASGNIAKYWEEGFRKYHPDVKFEWRLATSLLAIPGLVTGTADLGASRPITWDEQLLFQRVMDRAPIEITAVTGSFHGPGFGPALGIFVSKDNPISKLTLKQLDGIFGAERSGGWKGMAWEPGRRRGPEDNIRTWGQLGLGGEWADKPIHVYGRNLKFHEQLKFEQVVFQGGSKWNETIREYANDTAPDGSFVSSSEVLMTDLGNDRYAIGYGAGMSTAQKNGKVKAVALSVNRDSGPFVDFTIENVQNRTYPLIDNVYFYFDHKPGQPVDPNVREFIRYALSREGQQAVARDGKYLPLTAEAVRTGLKKLE